MPPPWPSAGSGVEPRCGLGDAAAALRVDVGVPGAEPLSDDDDEAVGEPGTEPRGNRGSAVGTTTGASLAAGAGCCVRREANSIGMRLSPGVSDCWLRPAGTGVMGSRDDPPLTP